jgi:hypothetical protein
METRGILRPSAVGTMFTLERRLPPPDLATVIDRHWLVAWDRRGQPVYESEVLPHPSVHLVVEPHGAFVYGVMRRRYVRRLEGTGWGIGTKFLPGGFAPFAGARVSELTDRVVPVTDLFGSGAGRLEAAADTDASLHALHDLLRAPARCHRPTDRPRPSAGGRHPRGPARQQRG